MGQIFIGLFFYLLTCLFMKLLEPYYILFLFELFAFFDLFSELFHIAFTPFDLFRLLFSNETLLLGNLINLIHLEICWHSLNKSKLRTIWFDLRFNLYN